jgi:hypothetical protein
MQRKIRPPGRAARAQARALVDAITQATLRQPESSGGYVRLQVTMLWTALEHLLAYFDYEAEIRSHAAVAARLIALSLQQSIWVSENQTNWAEPLTSRHS